jgi:hypothetical protein
MDGRALELKSKGDVAFKRKEFAQAEMHYQNAIGLCPTAATLWSNLSLVQLKQEKCDEALRSAYRVCSLGRYWERSYMRKCKAHLEMNDVPAAFAASYTGLQKAHMPSTSFNELHGQVFQQLVEGLVADGVDMEEMARGLITPIAGENFMIEMLPKGQCQAIQCYSTAQWVQASCFPVDVAEPQEFHSCAAIGNKRAVCFGGRYSDGRYSCDITVLTLEAENRLHQQRQACTGDVPAPRAAHTSCAIGASMFVFGGRTDDGLVNTLHKLNTSTWEWEQLAASGGGSLTPMPFAAEEASLTPISEHELVLFGGRGEAPVAQGMFKIASALPPNCYLFDTAQQTWADCSQNGACPCWRWGHAASVTPHTEHTDQPPRYRPNRNEPRALLISGGVNAAGIGLIDVYTMNLNSRCW